MKSLLNKSLSELRNVKKADLLSHVEGRLSTLAKRSIAHLNERNEANNRDMMIDYSRLNQETLAHLASVLNRVSRS